MKYFTTSLLLYTANRQTNTTEIALAIPILVTVVIRPDPNLLAGLLQSAEAGVSGE